MYLQADHYGYGGAAVARLAFGLAAPRVARAPVSLVVDLGRDLGSLGWWRGVVTLFALLLGAWTLAPRLQPLPQSALTSAADARLTTVTTLASGSRTGRRLVATDAVQPVLDAPERPRLDLTLAALGNEPLVAALRRAGVGMTEASRIATLAASAGAPERLPANTALTLTLGKRDSRFVPRPVETLRYRARFDLRVVVQRVGGELVLRAAPVTVDGAPLRMAGLVGEGIFLSATAAGAPVEVVQAYLQAIAARVPLGALEPGSRYEFVVERQRAGDGQVRFGRLLYAALTQPSAGSTRLIEWPVAGVTRWLDLASASETRSGGFMAPVEGRRTSGFGLRIHPILGYSRMHQGTDYAAYAGTPIRATADGTVYHAGWHGGHGLMVKLNHGGGMGSGYAHMSRIAVAPGERVQQGQVIGYVGSTGLSTGPHLHFEVYRNGRPVDPGSASFTVAPVLPPAELAAFKARMAELAGVR